MKKVVVLAFCALFSIGMYAQSNTGNLPGTAQDYVNQHFSSVSVVKVDENSNWQIWEDDKYEVVLSNGLKLDFDENRIFWQFGHLFGLCFGFDNSFALSGWGRQENGIS